MENYEKFDVILFSLGTGCAVGEKGKKTGSNRKNIGERSEPIGDLGRGKGRRLFEVYKYMLRP